MPPSPSLPWRVLRGALAPVVPLSFGAPGHAVAARSFTPLASMTGRTVLITGANGGLGFAAAVAMARLGARVVMAARSPERGAEARAALAAAVPGSDPGLEILDVADPGSIATFAHDWGERPLDVLVHNAAVLPAAYARTPNGEEQTLATNLLGPFRLTRALRPALERSTDARIVIVSSGGMFTQRLDLDRLDPEPEAPFDGAVAYARTKRALVTLGELWAERFVDPPVGVHAMHPGWADTPGVRSSLPRFHRLTRSILRTPEQGADTIVWLAATPAETLGTGGFWFDRRRVSPAPLPGTADPPDQRGRLWDWLERRA